MKSTGKIQEIKRARVYEAMCEMILLDVISAILSNIALITVFNNFIIMAYVAICTLAVFALYFNGCCRELKITTSLLNCGMRVIIFLYLINWHDNQSTVSIMMFIFNLKMLLFSMIIFNRAYYLNHTIH